MDLGPSTFFLKLFKNKALRNNFMIDHNLIQCRYPDVCVSAGHGALGIVSVWLLLLHLQTTLQERQVETERNDKVQVCSYLSRFMV